MNAADGRMELNNSAADPTAMRHAEEAADRSAGRIAREQWYEGNNGGGSAVARAQAAESGEHSGGINDVVCVVCERSLHALLSPRAHACEQWERVLGRVCCTHRVRCAPWGGRPGRRGWWKRDAALNLRLREQGSRDMKAVRLTIGVDLAEIESDPFEQARRWDGRAWLSELQRSTEKGRESAKVIDVKASERWQCAVDED